MPRHDSNSSGGKVVFMEVDVVEATSSSFLDDDEGTKT